MATPVEPVLEAQNTRVGVTGAVYVGAAGATPPATAEAAVTGYKGLGYINEDGVEETLDRSVDKLKAWQNAAVVRTVVTEAALSYKFIMIEETADTVGLFYSTTVDTLTGAVVIDPGATSGALPFVIDVIDGTDVIRAVFEGEVGETEAITYASGELIGYGVTVNVIGKVTKYYTSLITGP